MERYSTTKLLGFLYGDALNAYKRYYSYYGPDYNDPSQWSRIEVRDELRRRYEHGLDNKMIEDSFMVADDENSVWLFWQARKRKVATVRYQNPVLKRMEGYEEFADEEFLEDSILAFDDVIWIKDDSNFFKYGNGRLNAVIDIFEEESGLSIQYVGVEKDIWFCISDDERINSRGLYRKSHVPIEKHQRKLDLGCLAIEAFAEQIDSEASISASLCDKRDLLGKFMMEICDVDKYDDSKLSQSDLEKISPRAVLEAMKNKNVIINELVDKFGLTEIW